MSDSNFSLSRILVNEETQTPASIETTPELFNFNNDKINLETEYSLNHFKHTINEVEQLVSAVNGDDLTIRDKGRVITPRSKRFNKLLTSLHKQIQENSRFFHTNREQKILAERLTRGLAYAIDPASRYYRNKAKNQRCPLFSQQKYEYPMKLGHGNFFFKDPNQFSDCSNDYEIVYSYQNKLCFMNGSHIFVFDNFSPKSLTSGKEFQVSYKKRTFGSIILSNYFEDENEEEASGNENGIDTASPFYAIMPIIDDDRTSFLVHSLGGSDTGSGQSINLKSLINPYDFSFVDVILSIPRLTQSEATDFLTFLYKENYLSAYVRSKLCQFIYENRPPYPDTNQMITMKKTKSDKSTRVEVNVKSDSITKSLQSREWPELLGRFIALLDHSWFIESARRMENLELPQVVKSVAKNSESRARSDSRSTYRSSASAANPISPINPIAQYLLGIILYEFELLERGDASEFLWEFLCKSVFANLYLNKHDENSLKSKRKLKALFMGTKGKPRDSKTRVVTHKAVQRIVKFVKTVPIEEIIPKKSSPKAAKSKANSPKSPVESLNSAKFLLNLIQTHRDDIITVMKNIPRTTEEASPLFFPIALEIRDAMHSKFGSGGQENGSEVTPAKKGRASSLQRSAQKAEEEDEVDENEEEFSGSPQKTRKNEKRASSVSQNSKKNNRNLDVRRPSPIEVRKSKLPPAPASTTVKKGSKAPQKVSKSVRAQKNSHFSDDDEDIDVQVEYEYEYEEVFEEEEEDLDEVVEVKRKPRKNQKKRPLSNKRK